MAANVVLSLAAYILMFLGLVGAVLPILPGAPLIWLGALLWAIGDGFRAVGAPTLIVLAVLAALSWGADLLVTSLSVRRAGAGWKSVGVAIVCGVVGAFLFGSVIPVLGAVPGTLISAVSGMVLVEYHAKRDWRQAWQAAAAFVIGYLVSSLVQIAICLMMIGIFVWQAFF